MGPDGNPLKCPRCKGPHLFKHCTVPPAAQVSTPAAPIVPPAPTIKPAADNNSAQAPKASTNSANIAHTTTNSDNDTKKGGATKYNFLFLTQELTLAH